MQTGLHALEWGLLRLGIAAGLIGIAVVLAYLLIVFVIVAAQAGAALGQ